MTSMNKFGQARCYFSTRILPHRTERLQLFPDRTRTCTIRRRPTLGLSLAGLFTRKHKHLFRSCGRREDAELVMGTRGTVVVCNGPTSTGPVFSRQMFRCRFALAHGAPESQRQAALDVVGDVHASVHYSAGESVYTRQLNRLLWIQENMRGQLAMIEEPSDAIKQLLGANTYQPRDVHEY